MDVIYAINARLGGGGIGNTSFQAVQGPERAKCLKRVICSSNAQTDIPRQRVRSLGPIGRLMKRIAVTDASGRLDEWVNVVFDLWSSAVLEPCDVLHCWSDLGRTLARGKRQRAVTVLECMIHPTALSDMLFRELGKWGARPIDLPSAQRLQRYLNEIETSDFITVPSEFNRLTHIAQGVPDRKLRVVPYGVDTQHFHPGRDAPLTHPFRVVFVGNFSIRKGAPYLLEAWKLLGWRDAELWIVGNIAHDMSVLIQRHWLDVPGVRFQGFHPDVLGLYHQSDVFVFPSLGEGSALVTYEAMASGLPVVVTDNAGSLARADIDGEVIAPASSDAIAAALERMRSDPKRRMEMGRNARQRIQSYSWHSYGDRLMEVYRQLA